MRLLAALFFAALFALGAACTGESPDADAGPAVDAGAPSGVTVDDSGCMTYREGMQLQTEDDLVTITLLSASPAPPDVGNNGWRLALLNADGAALSGASVKIAPFMPAHGHGTSPAEFEGVEGEPGIFDLGPFDLFMPGTWEVTTTVTLSDESAHVAVFTFCVEG